MYSKELTNSSLPLQAGAKGKDVIKLQDWLRLNNYDTGGSDGDFGPKTLSSVKKYQAAHGMQPTGVVDIAMWNMLVSPLQYALNFKPISTKFSDAVVEVAKAHNSVHPTELDQNRDGWVRTYCQGPDGAPYAWCQGFASTIWMQAAESLKINPPIDLIIDNQWCLFVPTIAHRAEQQGRFISGASARNNPLSVVPGSMFFVKGGEYGWTHVGIVTDRIGLDGYFATIEGNTNTDGSSNGWEVCARKRLVSTCDFGSAA